MNYSDPYIDFLVHFHGDRDYFECHEILEAHWISVANKNKQSVWKGFILLCVANYHYRRENFIGATKTIEKGLTIFQQNKEQLAKLGMDAPLFIDMCAEQFDDIKAHVPYASVQLPIEDQTLMDVCRQRSVEKGFVWGSDSTLADEQLIHRHMLRDRSSVIEERERKLVQKRLY